MVSSGIEVCITLPELALHCPLRQVWPGVPERGADVVARPAASGGAPLAGTITGMVLATPRLRSVVAVSYTGASTVFGLGGVLCLTQERLLLFFRTWASADEPTERLEVEAAAGMWLQLVCNLPDRPNWG